VRVTAITYPSGNDTCAGDLYRPAGSGSGPGLVLGHGFNMTRAALREEAAWFCAAGYTVLAIDYRNFGSSGGSPRGRIEPRQMVADLRNAVTVLAGDDAVDAKRIGMWGASFGGGLALHAAALDHRVRAVVAQSAITDGRRWMRELRSGHQWRLLLRAVEKDFAAQFSGQEPRRIPATGAADLVGIPVPAAGLTRARYSPSNPVANPVLVQPDWCPTITLDSIGHIIDFEPAGLIDLIAPRPLLMIGNAGYDETHFLDHIQRAFKRAGEPKRLVLLPFDGSELYEEPGRTVALTEAAGFFAVALGAGAPASAQPATARPSSAPG
jgi:pimeloyl-ACP methyl ester carboxylesterase